MFAADDLIAIMPRCPLAQAPRYARLLDAAMREAQINTVTRAACFLGQWAWESDDFTRWVEDLDYTAEGIARAWPRRFASAASALAYAHAPERLANRVYAERLGNGDEASGDGWKFRGRGPPMLTGRDNYLKAGAALALPLEEFPDKIAEPEVGFRVAAWYWGSRKLNARADQLDYTGVTLAIAGSAVTGAPSWHNKRLELIQLALGVLGRSAALP